MSRTLKLVVYAAIVEMALVALAIFAWRHGAFSAFPAPEPDSRSRPIVAILPVLCAAGAVYAGGRLASERPRISDSHRRYLEGGLQATTAILVALQGLYAYVDVSGAKIDTALMGRGVIAFIGLWFMIQGNAAAKLDPPSGDGAPPPAMWTRMLLRSGWIMVVLGLVMLVSALALPRAGLPPVGIGVLAVGAALELAYRRMTRPANP